MTQREILIELLKKTQIGEINERKVFAGKILLPKTFEAFADQLLSNGVIVATYKEGANKNDL
jgi:hypothetical protein